MTQKAPEKRVSIKVSESFRNRLELAAISENMSMTEYLDKKVVFSDSSPNGCGFNELTMEEGEIVSHSSGNDGIVSAVTVQVGDRYEKGVVMTVDIPSMITNGVTVERNKFLGAFGQPSIKIRVPKRQPDIDGRGV